MTEQASSDPRFLDLPPESRLREQLQKAERGHALRPGALCPHCGGHAFRRQEIRSGAPCPRCGKDPRVAA